MSKHSILVALSGTEQSSMAAEMAWKLAKTLDATVTAEHIIDSRTVWELLRSDPPGFIGSGPYVQAYSAVIDALQSLGSKLSIKYEAMAEGAGVNSACLVKEGNPVELLSHDAEEHDLIIVGHSPSGSRVGDIEFSQYIRHSIAEGIVHKSKAPVLIIQSRPTAWESLTIVSEIDHINIKYIRSCINFAHLIGLKPNLEFWGTGTREEQPDTLKQNLFKEIPETLGISVEVEYFTGHAATERSHLFHGLDIEQAALLPSETLFSLPTRGIGQERLTVFGLEPEECVRQLTLPGLLFWPEENDVFSLGSNTNRNQLIA